MQRDGLFCIEARYRIPKFFQFSPFPRPSNFRAAKITTQMIMWPDVRIFIGQSGVFGMFTDFFRLPSGPQFWKFKKLFDFTWVFYATDFPSHNSPLVRIFSSGDHLQRWSPYKWFPISLELLHGAEELSRFLKFIKCEEKEVYFRSKRWRFSPQTSTTKLVGLNVHSGS